MAAALVVVDPVNLPIFERNESEFAVNSIAGVLIESG